MHLRLSSLRCADQDGPQAISCDNFSHWSTLCLIPTRWSMAARCQLVQHAMTCIMMLERGALFAFTDLEKEFRVR